MTAPGNSWPQGTYSKYLPFYVVGHNFVFSARGGSINVGAIDTVNGFVYFGTSNSELIRIPLGYSGLMTAALQVYSNAAAGSIVRYLAAPDEVEFM
jgi:hypothetical protein